MPSPTEVMKAYDVRSWRNLFDAWENGVTTAIAGVDGGEARRYPPIKFWNLKGAKWTTLGHRSRDKLVATNCASFSKWSCLMAELQRRMFGVVGGYAGEDASDMHKERVLRACTSMWNSFGDKAANAYLALKNCGGGKPARPRKKRKTDASSGDEGGEDDAAAGDKV
jgi:hypothetical protein